MSTPASPLGVLAWPGQTGVNNVGGQLPNPTGQTSTSTNPYGLGTIGGGALAGNLAETNLQTGQLKNQLIPQYAQNLFGMGNAAGNFFNQLMNLGSPYYQQQQAATFQNTNQQNQNAAANAQQQLRAQGYGFTPSGATAAMLGGMGTGAAQNLSTNFLQNLFNNEQLQLAGAQGLTSLASLFNPANLLGSSVSTAIQQPENTAAQIMQGIGSLISGGGYSNSSGGGITV